MLVKRGNIINCNDLKTITNSLKELETKLIKIQNNLKENQMIISELNIQKKNNLMKKATLIKEKEIFLNYNKYLFQKSLPYLLLPTILFISSISYISFNIELSLGLLTIGGIVSISNLIQFKIKNQDILKIKQKGIKSIKKELDKIECFNKSSENVIKGIEKNNKILMREKIVLQTFKKSLINQKQKLSPNLKKELDINKSKVKTSSKD